MDRRARTGVIFLCVRPTERLRTLASPLCLYHDVYLCADHGAATPGGARLPQAFEAGEIHVDGSVAASAGFRGSVSWLPHRASSRCKALYWLCRVYRGPITHWWLLEEDVLVPTEAALLAIDARLPDADLIVPHHHPQNSGRPHWSGLRTWPHWHRGREMFMKRPSPPRLFSSLVCGMRMSTVLAQQIDRHVALQGRLGFCEIMFSTLAAAAGLRIHTPPELTGSIRWRHAWEKHRAHHPAMLYHPVKDLAVQAHIRQQGSERPDWRKFVEALIADDKPAAEEMRRRWGSWDSDEHGAGAPTNNLER